MNTSEESMDFDVVYILTIYDAYRKKFTAGHREAKIPFVPFPGLEVLNSGIGFGLIEKVSWEEESNLFRCYLEYEIDALDIDDDIEFQIRMAKRGGFEGFENTYETSKNS